MKIHFAAFILLFCFISFLACTVPRKGPLKKLTIAKTVAPIDVLIVPGIPFENGNWDTVMKGRVIWSWILYKNGIVKNIIYSGDAVYSPYRESEIMGLYAQQIGIPKEHIFYDTMARHSTENVYYSYLLAKQLGFKSIALGTDPFQEFTLRSFTKKRFRTKIYNLPFFVYSLKQYNGIAPEIDYKPLRRRPWKTIYEQQGFFKRFRGTLGKDIDWSRHKDGKVEAL